MSIPKLRFKEFNNNWEYYKIKDIFENISIKNHPEMTILTIIQSNGTIPRSQSNRNIIFDEEKSFTYKVVNKNDFIIHLRSFEGGLEMSNHNGIVSPAYTIIRGNNKVIPLFFKYYFRTNKFINQILSKAVEGIRDGRQISYSQLKDFNIPLPSLEEQNKIVDFLSLINKKIELQTQLVDNLNLYKKGLLKKVFSNNQGWKTAKLGKYIIQLSNRNKNNIDYYVLSVSNSKGFIKQIEHFNDRELASENKSNYKIVSKYEFAYNPARINVGSIAMLESFDCGIVSPMYICFKCNNIYHSFLKYFFLTNEFKNQMKVRLEGSVRMCLSYEALSNINIPIPSIEEQNRIADLFTNLDKKIDFETKKLENLKTYKKGLLQKMFI